MVNLIWYPKCSTCQKAKKYLDSKGIEPTTRHIVEEPLNEKEIEHLYKKSALPLKRFFNTSGMRYRDLNLKEKLPSMDEAEQIALLASDGMLVKRPILETKDNVLVGFKPTEYDTL
jgi:arsenate reductase